MGQLVSVREAAQRLNRPQESVRKIVADRGIEKHYVPGKQRFGISWEKIQRAYLEIQAAGR